LNFKQNATFDNDLHLPYATTRGCHLLIKNRTYIYIHAMLKYNASMEN